MDEIAVSRLEYQKKKLEEENEGYVENDIHNQYYGTIEKNQKEILRLENMIQTQKLKVLAKINPEDEINKVEDSDIDYNIEVFDYNV